MTPELSAARTYTDLHGLSELRAAARDRSPEAAEEVARQFEALLVQMMLKSMRAASFGDPVFGSDATRFYRDLFDRQVSLELASRSRLGLADLLARDLGAGAAARTPVQDAGALPPAREAGPGAAEQAQAPGERSAAAASPDEFARTLWPEARRTGAALGVDPRLLIAQAALETGWGRAIIHDPQGRSSHNLFGIKADARWPGPRVTVGTLEYDDGVAVRARADFRSYDSFAESFDDYARFLRSEPRYREALARASDPRAYVQALQSAGYATDPRYAAKVLDIYSRGAGDALKHVESLPLQVER